MKYQVIKDFLHPDLAANLEKHIYGSTSDKWTYYYKSGEQEKPSSIKADIRGIQSKLDYRDVLKKSLQAGHFTYSLKRLSKCTESFCSCPLCSFRETVLKTPDFLQFIGQLASVDNLELVEMFASVYGQGDFLSIHPDPNFDVAFIFNLTNNWKYEYGGCLTIFDEEDAPPKVILPEYNSLVLLYLGADGIDHYISEVSSLAPHSRIALSGWFNAPEK